MAIATNTIVAIDDFAIIFFKIFIIFEFYLSIDFCSVTLYTYFALSHKVRSEFFIEIDWIRCYPFYDHNIKAPGSYATVLAELPLYLFCKQSCCADQFPVPQ